MRQIYQDADRRQLGRQGEQLLKGLLVPGKAAQAKRFAFRFLERAWLEGDGVFPCWVSPTEDFAHHQDTAPEIFTAMVILDLLVDSPISLTLKADVLELLRTKRSTQGVHHFFTDESKLPADTDCTAVAHSLLLGALGVPRRSLIKVARMIASNVCGEGVLATYFTRDPKRQNIVDPVVCANGLQFLTLMALADLAAPTVAFLYDVLEQRMYEQGTRYYPSPDAFLYSLSRLVGRFPQEYGRFWPLLQRRLRERMAATEVPLEMAFRAISAQWLDLRGPDQKALTLLQTSTGAWPAGPFFRYGRSGVFFGSECLTTAFCLRATGW